MGLDGVELVMECEDEFGINISDADSTKVQTPGQLTDLVLRLMRDQGDLPASTGCPSTRLFYSVRQTLMNAGVSRDEIRPSSTLGQLLPTAWQVRQTAYELQALAGVEVVRTPFDRYLQLRMTAITLIIGLAFTACGLLIERVVHVPGLWVVFVVFAFIASCMTFMMQRMTRSGLVHPERTIREQIEYVTNELERYSDHPDEYAVWVQVRKIVSELLGVSVEKVTPDADFVKDLGLI